jgi:hypothetical protein
MLLNIAVSMKLSSDHISYCSKISLWQAGGMAPSDKAFAYQAQGSEFKFQYNFKKREREKFPCGFPIPIK